MSETAPERVWLDRPAGKTYQHGASHEFEGGTEYVRADLQTALQARVEELEAALTELLEALDATDAEPEKAKEAGRAWSSAPAVRSIYARKAARATLTPPEQQ